MSQNVSRRKWLQILGLTGAGALWRPDRALADRMGSPKKMADVSGYEVPPAGLVNGKVIEPQREVPVLSKTDVLVVGGGPAGVAAAIAARRTGAKVTLVERYGHFGGLWTGGLVLIVIGHIVKGGKQVCQGVGEEMLQRLEKLDRGIINRTPGVNPTVDAEALKYVMVEMVTEAGVDVLLHCWGIDAIMDGNAIRGAVFQSKSGRQAVVADVVIDATGDGDIFAAAGANHAKEKFSIGLVSRIGNLDRVDQAKAAAGPKPRLLGSPTPVAGVNWVNMRGPDGDGLDVRELTKLELNHRRFIWQTVEKIRKTPGYEQVYLMETAPQLGVRVTRVLDGVEQLTLENMKAGKRFDNCIGVGGAWHAEHEEWQIPYGTLVPKNVEGLLAAGRCISAEPDMVDLMRVIPICYVTGHAAGVAAAVALKDRSPLRSVDIGKVQKVLKEQKAYLG